jgi:hypothetical protein
MALNIAVPYHPLSSADKNTSVPLVNTSSYNSCDEDHRVMIDYADRPYSKADR